MLKYVFGVAVHQEKPASGLRFKETLTRKKHDTVLNKAEIIRDARIKIDNLRWYVPHYTLFIPQQVILPKHILKKTTHGASIY